MYIHVSEKWGQKHLADHSEYIEMEKMAYEIFFIDLLLLDPREKLSKKWPMKFSV